MLKLERQLFIEKELHEKGSVLVSELSKVLDCLRRDNTPGISRKWKRPESSTKFMVVPICRINTTRVCRLNYVNHSSPVKGTDGGQGGGYHQGSFCHYAGFQHDMSEACGGNHLIREMYYIDHQFAAYQFSV